jgi:hypothetical protein
MGGVIGPAEMERIRKKRESKKKSKKIYLKTDLLVFSFF